MVGTAEVESHVMVVWLSKPAKAFLSLEQFFSEPWAPEIERQ